MLASPDNTIGQYWHCQALKVAVTIQNNWLGQGERLYLHLGRCTSISKTTEASLLRIRWSCQTQLC